MVYARGVAADERLHRQHCGGGSGGGAGSGSNGSGASGSSSAAAVKFPGWGAAERVVAADAPWRGARVVLVLPSDAAPRVRKAREAAALAERLHCLAPGSLLAGDGWRAFLCVAPAAAPRLAAASPLGAAGGRPGASTAAVVVGLLVAEPLRRAWRAVAPGQREAATPEAAAVAGTPGACSQEQQQRQRAMGADPGSGGGQQGGTPRSSFLSRLTATPAGKAPSASSGAAAGSVAEQAAAAVATPPAASSGGGAGGRALLSVDRSRPARAAVGVRMVWVAPDRRRRGVASRLLDAARANAAPAYVAPRGEVAFARPTEACAALAAAYAGADGWLVYDD